MKSLNTYLVEKYGSDVPFEGTDVLTHKQAAYVVNGNVRVGWDVYEMFDFSFENWWREYIDFDKYKPEGLERYDVQYLSRERKEFLSTKEFDMHDYLENISLKYIDIDE